MAGRTAPCKYYRPHAGSGCRDGDGCQYVHAPASRRPCRDIIAVGFCGAGDACRFRHDLPGAGARSPGGAAAAALALRSWQPPALPEDEARRQHALGAQSLRGVPGGAAMIRAALGAGSHASQVLLQMLEREKKLAGDWVVFYHSYNSPAFVYEVNAAIARALFRFGAEYAPLPRLLKAPYERLPDASAVLQAFPTWPDQDHNPAFKSVGICCSTSLVSQDPEATPVQVFNQGYAASTVDLGVLMRVLQDCGADLGVGAGALVERIRQLAIKHGLPQATGSGSQGHLLQIFVHRRLVDKFVYAAVPGGAPDPTRSPLSAHLAGPGVIVGQGRIVTNPSAFMRAGSVRMFVGSADAKYHHQRRAFQAELATLLHPILGDPVTRQRAATGVYNGKLPGWWKDVA